MKNLGFLLLICMLASCGGSSDQGSYQPAYEEKRSYKESSQPGNDEQSVERKIIKTAEIRFQVKDLSASTENITAITERFSGFVSNLYQANSNYELSNNLTIRVPAEKLDEFMVEIEKESIFTNYKRISSQDVTEEYVDITTRLETKKEVRDRYIDILRNKAKTVQDILDAEEKIRVIQEEIESIEGRIKYLNNQADLSTVVVDLYQEVEYVKAPDIYKKSFLTKLKEGLSNGWDLVLDIIVGLVTIWPVILIIVLFILFRKKIRNPFKRKNV